MLLWFNIGLNIPLLPKKKGNFCTPNSICTPKRKGFVFSVRFLDVLGWFPEVSRGFFCAPAGRALWWGELGEPSVSHHQGLLRWALIRLNFITWSVRISSLQEAAVYEEGRAKRTKIPVYPWNSCSRLDPVKNPPFPGTRKMLKMHKNWDAAWK